MRQRIKHMTILFSSLVFGMGIFLAVKESGSENSITSEIEAETKLASNEIKETSAAVETTQAEETTVEETTVVVQTQRETETTTKETVIQETTIAIPPQPTTQAETTQIETKTQPQTTKEVTTVAQDEIVLEVFRLINAERSDVNVSSVVLDNTLIQMAMTRAKENADNNWFVVQNGHHIRPNGQNASTICNEFGQTGKFGEVMGRYQKTPQSIVAGWHKSATHYACMTNTVYTRVGVGYALDSNGKYYWVAIFMN